MDCKASLAPSALELSLRLGSFIICDPYTRGFPIRYPSQGFVDLFGHSVADCLGHKCGELVGSKSIFVQGSMEKLAMDVGVAPTELSTALASLNTYVGRQVRRTVRGKQASTRALLINWRKSGELFVCELVTIVPKHPALGWRYYLGIQRDVTAEIPVSELVQSICRGGYAELLAGRNAAQQELLDMVGIPENMAYLHEKAAATWHALMSELIPLLSSEVPKPRRRRRGLSKRSVASLSTCSGFSKTSNTSGSADASEKERKDAVRERQLGTGVGSSSDVIDSGGSASSGATGSAPTEGHSSKPGEEQVFSDDTDGGGEGAGTPTEPSQVRLGIVEELREKGDIRALPFPMCIVDATDVNQRIVECTDSFAKLTGYEVSSILGSDMNFLLRGIPAYLWDAEATAHIRELCAQSAGGVFLQVAQRIGLDFEPTLASGELLCEQICAKKEGELFRSLVLLKQVELDDEMFLLMFHERVPVSDDWPSQDTEYEALNVRLSDNVDATQKTLASLCFFSAPPRRQIA